MKKTSIPADHTKTAVYNADEARLVGVFAARSMAAEFICGGHKPRAAYSKVQCAMDRKTRILPKSSQLPFKVAVRIANADQINMLGSEDYILIDDSLVGFLSSIRPGFHTTRLDLYYDHVVNAGKRYYPAK
jgi:hypothetical protein